ncbi:MAG: ABC transporter ATP-binding protein [Caldilineales bacterium]|nr:ABC transporter ATP-binding protein [Caldilineales bacterium]MCW5858667.1 ABC transporter ATP-binding protein [Caldilineales bacterium]
MNTTLINRIVTGAGVRWGRETTGVLTNGGQAAGYGTTHVLLAGLSKQYGDSHAVRDLNLDLPAGKITALLGPSGCGKTTTLKMIAGLIPPTAGDIAFDGASVAHVPAERRGAVMVFQNHLLFPHLSVAENVAFGLQLRGEDRSTIRRKVRDMLARVRLDGLGDRQPRQLSGGQAQRVTLARALVVEPRVLLLDEPLSNLDAHLRDEMRELILDLQRGSGITTVFVTHDQEEAALLADRVVLLLDGVLQQVGEPRAFYERPASAAVARFFGGVNFLPGVRAGSTVHTPLGAFRLAAANQPDGPVTLTIRPENVRLCCSNEAPSENSIAGVVSRRAYAGAYTRLKVETRGQRFEVVTDAAEGGRFEEGDPVRLHFLPERLWLLPAEPNHTAGEWHTKGKAGLPCCAQASNFNTE